MKNRILPWLLVFASCLAMVCSFPAFAAQLDTEASCSLTLHYQTEGEGFSDLKIDVFRVAEANADGTFELIPPFSSYPVHIHDITQQSQWKDITTTLSAYIIADQVQPDCAAHTDAQGTVQFSNMKTGLYLVREVIAENEKGTYIFDGFMIYVPTPQPDGHYEYQVEAKPKCTGFQPKTQYTVTKLWQDEGSEAVRPKEVTVDIFKDGVLMETRILNAQNNWSYTWSVTQENNGSWAVQEREVPEGYKVTIRQNDNVFSIINAKQTDPITPPQTGDTFTPLPWIIAMCSSGMMLVLLGIYSRRRNA